MHLEIFSIYDQKAEAHLPPFFLPTKAMAIRTFKDCVNNPEHAFGRNPGDYTLFHLGHWDDEDTNFYVEFNGQKSLGTGIEHKTQQELDLSMAPPAGIKTRSGFETAGSAIDDLASIDPETKPQAIKK